LSVDIGGASTGQFGSIQITGAALLAGTLNVNLDNGFLPVPGDSFTIITFGSEIPVYIYGVYGFDTFVGWPYNVLYDPQDVTLSS
jgi:hypothetical protein